MFRRGLSLLVTAGLLAGQLAVAPHAHADHSAVPHIHCSWFGLADHHAHHGHSHSHHGHRHPPSDDPRCTGGSHDHDADAIFVSGQTLTGAGPKCPVVSPLEFSVFSSLADGAAGVDGSSSPSIRWHPPDKVLDASATYLILRNLRI